MIKEISEILGREENGLVPPHWSLRAVQSEQCQSYLAWNESTREAILIDPKKEDQEAYRSLRSKLKDYLWLAVVDTHTHADHVSIAAKMAEELGAPLVMHHLSPSQRVQLRVCADTRIPSRAAPVLFIPTPGHTPDGICVLWGPFLFTGDTILFGDTGRDDLPGGDAEAHFQSIERLKSAVPPEAILLPGHDPKGGRASSWKRQLSLNSSLTQGRAEFVGEASAFRAAAPDHFKESLFENMK